MLLCTQPTISFILLSYHISPRCLTKSMIQDTPAAAFMQSISLITILLHDSIIIIKDRHMCRLRYQHNYIGRRTLLHSDFVNSLWIWEESTVLGVLYNDKPNAIAFCKLFNSDENYYVAFHPMVLYVSILYRHVARVIVLLSICCCLLISWRGRLWRTNLPPTRIEWPGVEIEPVRHLTSACRSLSLRRH